MEIRPDLIRELDELTVALDESGDDLTTILTVLLQDLATAVDSVTGLSLTVISAGEPVTVTALTSYDAAASMLLPLGPVQDGPATAHVIFYASRPGAFVDLAADTRAHYGLDRPVVLDGNLPPPSSADEAATLHSLHQRSTVNRAIGVLVEQGYVPAAAEEELVSRAASAGLTKAQMAEVIEENSLITPVDRLTT